MTSANPAFLKSVFTAYARKQLLGKKVMDYIYIPEHHSKRLETWHQFAALGICQYEGVVRGIHVFVIRPSSKLDILFGK